MAPEFERMMKSCIADMHKKIAAKEAASQDSSTSPTTEPTTTDTTTAGKKRSWKAVTSREYNGPF